MSEESSQTDRGGHALGRKESSMHETVSYIHGSVSPLEDYELIFTDSEESLINV